MSHSTVNQIYTIGCGLNIEGGLPKCNLIRDNPNKKVLWANLILVLDRPLVDNVLFSEIDQKMKDHNYPLLENTIDEINEHQMFAIYLATICYYIENGNRLLDKQTNDKLHLTIHVHQSKLSMQLIDILHKLILKTNIDISHIHFDYRTDDPIFIATPHYYNDTDILISLSQSAGLDPTIVPGKMVISELFIPYDFANKKIYLGQGQFVENDILNNLANIIGSKYNMDSVDLINKEYVSKNLIKIDHKATPISLNDFIFFANFIFQNSTVSQNCFC